MKRKIAILGSTGSIGTQTLDVARANGDIRVEALAAHGVRPTVVRPISEVVK